MKSWFVESSGHPDAEGLLSEWLPRGCGGTYEPAGDADGNFTARLTLEDASSRFGFTLKCGGDTAEVISGSERGLYCGAEELLHRLYGFEPFAADEIAFTPREYDTLPDFSVTDEPSFPYRCYLCSQPERKRTRDLLRFQDSIWAGPQGRWFHTTLNYLPYDVYGSEHPDWFGEKGRAGEERQVCYSTLAEGGEAYGVFLEAAKKVVLENPDKPNLSVTEEDSVTWCECPKCRAAAKKYGAEAAPMILFINRLAKDIEDWRRAEGMPGELDIVCFAYYRSLPAPVKLQNGEYVPTAPEMVLRDNVAVICAPISMDYSKPITHPDNGVFANSLRKWRVLCKKLDVWIYQTNFSEYLVPYDWFPTTAENYRFLRDLGVWCLYDQGQYSQTNPTAFNALKTYLSSKLQWDVDADQGELTDAFFANYYGVAAPYVRRYFDEVLANNARWHEEVGIGIEWYIYFKIVRPDVWREEDLRRWDGYLVDALGAVEASALGDGRRAVLGRRVELERVAVRYLLASLYDTDTAARRGVYEDLVALGVGKVSEGKNIPALKEDWNL